jgi:dolichol-phosphate mannosyltransferase
MTTTLVHRTGSLTGRTGNLAARSHRFARFGLVVVSGVVVNEATLALLVEIFHTNYLLGAVIATQCSTLWNFVGAEWWAFGDAAGPSGRLRRFVMFWAVNMMALVLRIPILALLTSVFHLHYLISNLISFGVLVVLRFAIADSLIWSGAPAPSPSAHEPVAPAAVSAHVPRAPAAAAGTAPSTEPPPAREVPMYGTIRPTRQPTGNTGHRWSRTESASRAPRPPAVSPTVSGADPRS